MTYHFKSVRAPRWAPHISSLTTSFLCRARFVAEVTGQRTALYFQRRLVNQAMLTCRLTSTSCMTDKWGASTEMSPSASNLLALLYQSHMKGEKLDVTALRGYQQRKLGG